MAQWTTEEIIEIFSKCERMLRVDLFKKFEDWNVAHGLTEEIGGFVAAQGVNYLTGEEWADNLLEDNQIRTTEEMKRVIDEHGSQILPFFKAMLKTDKMCREIIVNYLRIKDALLFAAGRDKYMRSEDKRRIDNILSIYGPEFPGEPDMDRFGKLMMDFHHTVFPEKK